MLWAPATWWQPIYLQHGRPASSTLTLHHNFLRIYTFMNHKRKEASPLSIALVKSLVNLTNTKCKGTKKKERTLKRSFVHWSKINMLKSKKQQMKSSFSHSVLYTAQDQTSDHSQALEKSSTEKGRRQQTAVNPWELTLMARRR